MLCQEAHRQVHRPDPQNQSTPSYHAQEFSSKQHFSGSICTLLFGASLLSERLNGCGIVEQLELHEGFEQLLITAVVGLTIAAIWPPNKEEMATYDRMDSLQQIAARFSYGGLAGMIAAEMATGKVRLLPMCSVVAHLHPRQSPSHAFSPSGDHPPTHVPPRCPYMTDACACVWCFLWRRVPWRCLSLRRAWRHWAILRQC